MYATVAYTFSIVFVATLQETVIPMHNHPIVFHFRMDERTRNELERVAEKLRCSRAEAMRRLVQNAHDHAYNAAFCCADGARCHVPQMHSTKGITP